MKPSIHVVGMRGRPFAWRWLAACVALVPAAVAFRPIESDRSPADAAPARSSDAAPAHWAFRPVERPAVPASRDTAWPRNAIDQFVLARLEQERLMPSPEADRVTLIRRLSLDLIGLPPTIEEVDAFVADAAPDAYERLVERLLESPHYGERWGRHWLDAARYADSDGFEKDKSRNVWFYRDYVIRAFNEDLPYDRFIIEQLAGDLLPDATQDQVVATGFLRNSMLIEEGGVDPEQFRIDGMFDRMDAIGKGILGLTIQCAVPSATTTSTTLLRRKSTTACSPSSTTITRHNGSSTHRQNR